MNYKGKDSCRKKFEIIFFQNLNNYQNLEFVLKFKSISTKKTSITNIGALKDEYKLIFQKNDKTESLEIDFEIPRISKTLLVFRVLETSKLGNLKGMIKLQKIKTSKYSLIDDLGYIEKYDEFLGKVDYNKEYYETKKQ